MSGFNNHGYGPLAPDEPTFICSSCHGAFWNASDLEDGDCHECIEENQDEEQAVPAILTEHGWKRITTPART